MTVLSVENLSVQREKQTILHDISMAIEAGEIIALIGPNGAGKTTLLNALIGIIPARFGRITLLGKPMSAYTCRERARHIGYIPQIRQAIPGYSVEEFILMARYPHLSLFSKPDAGDMEIVRESMEITGISGFRHRRMDTLSGGEQQKVLLCGIIAQQPALLLLDEPSCFLDPKNELEVQSLLQSIKQRKNIAVVHVSHNLNSALRFSDRTIALKSGQSIYSGHSRDLLRQPEVLSHIFDTPFRIIHDQQEQPVLVY